MLRAIVLRPRGYTSSSLIVIKALISPGVILTKVDDGNLAIMLRPS